MQKDKKFTSISEIGEFGLLDYLTKGIKPTNKNTIKGIGDDAAVIKISKNESLVISTDSLNEGVHFDLTYVPLMHLGYKSVIVNLSDIYAMNANPEQILVSIALSNQFSVEAVDELYKGIKKACKHYQVDLIGGDTISSRSGLVISVTAIGRTHPDKITYRSRAKEGDFLMVSGDLGGAYLGLQVLEREKAVFVENPNMQPELSSHPYLLGRQLKPEARKDVIEIFDALDIIPTSMIDVSDGLASEILHICKKSKVGANIYEEKLPVDSAVINLSKELNIDPTTCILNGGEDYELLFTVKPKDHDKLKNHLDFTSIGQITKKKEAIKLITRDKKSHRIIAQGWNNFNPNSSLKQN